jgi:RimJ/RimL family protein N-acetyltransferase
VHPGPFSKEGDTISDEAEGTNGGPARLRTHDVRLETPRLSLRPMTENDWPTLLRWNRDPRVLLYWSNGDVRPWSLQKLQQVYRTISEHASMFIAEREGAPVAECWLQEMNLTPILSKHAGQRVYRIDLSIGDPSLWGQGLGTEIVRALVEFGFRVQQADALFACHVRAPNVQSQRIFLKNGFQDWGAADDVEEATDGIPPRHLVLTRAQWSSSVQSSQAG